LQTIPAVLSVSLNEEHLPLPSKVYHPIKEDGTQELAPLCPLTELYPPPTHTHVPAALEFDQAALQMLTFPRHMDTTMIATNFGDRIQFTLSMRLAPTRL
jgi:hypothetical protein